MYKQHSHRKPDFFIILVLLVVLSFGLTVLAQLIASDVKNVVDTQPVKTLEARG